MYNPLQDSCKTQGGLGIHGCIVLYQLAIFLLLAVLLCPALEKLGLTLD